MKQKDTAKTVTIVLWVAFGMLSIGLLVYCALYKETRYFFRGLLFPLFYLIPWLFQKIKIKHCWRFYIVLYLFIIFAYSYGCVYGGFTLLGNGMDKLSHFLSGILFTILGFGLYYIQTGPLAGGIKAKPVLAGSYALFFSMFVGVVWEFCEFFGFLLWGNDSQNHLTTGVFDTMQDLLACFVASLLCIISFALYHRKGIKLLTGWILEEFYQKNIAPKAPKG